MAGGRKKDEGGEGKKEEGKQNKTRKKGKKWGRGNAPKSALPLGEVEYSRLVDGKITAVRLSEFPKRS